jgi:hypothetical protein
VSDGGPELKYSEYGHVKLGHVGNLQLLCNSSPLLPLRPLRTSDVNDDMAGLHVMALRIKL